MEILLQLGANETAFIQFALFIVSISFLTIFVYGPFFKAYDQRLKLTKGADQVAYETQDEVKKLESIYKSKAREINEKIKNIFDASKKEASESAQTIINGAKAQSTQAVDQARVAIEKQKKAAQADSAQMVQEISTQIVQKLTGR